MDKTELRQQVISDRKLLSPQDKTLKSLSIGQRLMNLEAIKNARAVAAYLDFRGEVETRAFIQELLGANIKVYLPRLVQNGSQMTFYAIESIEALETHLISNHFGIREPNPERCPVADLEILDVVVTPGVAFSQSGYRLGYGGGYYDRFFATIDPSIKRIGICFDLQVLEKVPTESHDIPLNMIITESRCLKIASFV